MTTKTTKTILPILFGYNVDGRGNSSIPFAFCEYWNSTDLPSLLYAPSCELEFRRPWLKTAFGPIMKKIAYRFNKPETIQDRTLQLFFEQQSASPHVYLWAGLPLKVFEYFHSLNAKIIIERINCHQATAKSILDEACRRLDILPEHDITEQSIEDERKKLDMATAIFCPSPMVYKSMLSEGVDESKLLQTSYGWSPMRFPELNKEPQDNRRPRFLFVGTLCVRKGVPLLLDAWDKAKVDGELIFVGKMSDTIQKYFGHYFDRYDITHVPYTNEIGIYYNMCDVFVFPSLEEGGPMVTYEAMAHAMVPVVSEMGAGAIVQDKANGLILEESTEQWIDAFRALSQNIPKRQEIGRQARARALEFTWEKVAVGRARLLKETFADLWS